MVHWILLPQQQNPMHHCHNIKRKENPLQTNWYDIVRQYTTQLVSMRSVSPGQGENMVVEEVLRLLRAGGLESVYTDSGLDPIEVDAYGRQNAYAFLRGKSPRAVVL